jgi:hypothetical protein
MKFIKQFRPGVPHKEGVSDACAQISTNTYCKTLDHITKMANMLKKDFPGITDEDISVSKYAGIRVKGVTFVEVFLDPETKKPRSYDKINHLEYIL